MSMGIKLVQILASLLVLVVALFPKSDAAGNIVVYWGQNEKEGSLAGACKSGRYNIVNIAFLQTYGKGQKPQINLAGQCDPASNGCQKVSTDIKNGQKRGIEVMLPICGGTYNISSDDDARKVADYIWNNFLGGQVPDLSATQFWTEWILTLRETETIMLRLGVGYQKKVYLTAAPRCPFLDKYLNGALSTGLFDYVWLQFYNNYCQYSTSPNGVKVRVRKFNSATYR